MIAVIVDNRPKMALEAIEKHQPFIKSWEIDWINDNTTTPQAYNEFLTSAKFWDKYQDHERVLIFQHDSGLLRRGIEDFLEWDYVGAPWPINAPWNTENKSGGNGGLSLRCPKKSLNLIRQKPYHPRYGNEDVYFSHFLPLVGGKVAPREVCKRFSCETEFELGTLGYHAIQKHLSKAQVERIIHQYD